MAKFTQEGIDPILVNRILAFINRVRDAESFVAQTPVNPTDPSDKWVGETVASRILGVRNAIPGRRLKDLAQLSDIQGFGQEKFEDMLQIFQVDPSEAFRLAMYNGVLLENWILLHDTTTITPKAEFLDTVDNECNFRTYISHELKRICQERFQNQQAAKLAERTLDGKYLERFEDAHLGSYPFAFWFYKIDMDNWFSFDTVRAKTEAYLSTYIASNHRLELRFFKGFNNSNILNTPLNTKDLPVVVNYAEQSISIWSAQLND